MVVINMDVFFTALSAMAKVFFICLSGALAAKFPRKSPLLPVTLLSQLSRLSNDIFLPCLMISSIGSVLTLQMLLEFLPLLFGSFVLIISSFLFSHLVRLLFCLPLDPLMEKLVIASTFPNCVSLPLLMLETLCEKPLVYEQFEDGEDQCYQTASAMCFIYSIGWHLLFWSWGYSKLRGSKETQLLYGDATNLESSSDLLKAKSADEEKKEVKAGERPPMANKSRSLHLFSQQTNLHTNQEAKDSFVTKAVKKLKGIFAQPTMSSIFIGFLVGLTPLKGLLFEQLNSPLRPLGSAVSSLATPIVVLSTMIMAGSLAQIDLKQFRTGSSDGPKEATVEISNSEEAPQWQGGSPIPGQDTLGAFMPSKKQFIFFLFCRLAAFPTAACIFLLAVVRNYIPIIKNNELLQLVLVVQAAVPSAQMIIVCLSLFKQQKIATGVSYLYVYQYLSSILSLTVVISLSMSYIYTA